MALTAAKLYFLVLGLGQQLLLTWLLKDGYGALRGALSPASITYNPLVTAGVQGMSRAVSRSQGGEPKSLRSALGVHFAIAFVAGGGFFLLAPLLGRVLNSAYLVPAFRWLGLAIFGYGLYAPLVGILNGQRRFLLQAGLDMLAATARTAALFVGAWLWLDQGTPRAVMGSSLAFSIVTLLLFLLTAVLARSGITGAARPTVREHLAFVAPVIGSQLLLNLLLQADTNTLRAFSTRAAERAGLAPTAADGLTGAYSAAQLFGFLPYQVLMGMSFIIFPMLARAQADGDRQSIRAMTQAGLRIALVVTGGIVSVSSGLAPALLEAAFPAFAAVGGQSMKTLCLGLGAFAVFGMATTVLNGLGRQWVSLLISAVALCAVLGFNALMVPGVPFGEGLLLATARATSLGILVGLAACVVEVWRTTRTFVAPMTLVRALAATAVAVVAGRLCLDPLMPLRSSNPPLFYAGVATASIAVFGLYVVLLIGLRELTGRDLQHVAAIVRRKRS